MRKLLLKITRILLLVLLINSLSLITFQFMGASLLSSVVNFSMTITTTPEEPPPPEPETPPTETPLPTSEPILGGSGYSPLIAVPTNPNNKKPKLYPSAPEAEVPSEGTVQPSKPTEGPAPEQGAPEEPVLAPSTPVTTKSPLPSPSVALDNAGAKEPLPEKGSSQVPSVTLDNTGEKEPLPEKGSSQVPSISEKLFCEMLPLSCKLNPSSPDATPQERIKFRFFWITLWLEIILIISLFISSLLLFITSPKRRSIPLRKSLPRSFRHR